MPVRSTTDIFSTGGSAVRILSSTGGAISQSLPIATGSGNRVEYLVSDNTNPMVISVPSGHTLNGVTDDNIDIATNEPGTLVTFTDSGSGQWIASVTNAANASGAIDATEITDLPPAP